MFRNWLKVYQKLILRKYGAVLQYSCIYAHCTYSWWEITKCEMLRAHVCLDLLNSPNFQVTLIILFDKVRSDQNIFTSFPHDHIMISSFGILVFTTFIIRLYLIEKKKSWPFEFAFRMPFSLFAFSHTYWRLALMFIV